MPILTAKPIMLSTDLGEQDAVPVTVSEIVIRADGVTNTEESLVIKPNYETVTNQDFIDIEPSIITEVDAIQQELVDARGTYPSIDARFEDSVNNKVFTGEFVVNSDTSTITVDNINVSDNCVIMLQPKNKTAATLSVTKGVYVNTRTTGTGFTVKLHDDSNFTLNSIFEYTIINN